MKSVGLERRLVITAAVICIVTVGLLVYVTAARWSSHEEALPQSLAQEYLRVFGTIPPIPGASETSRTMTQRFFRVTVSNPGVTEKEYHSVLQANQWTWVGVAPEAGDITFVRDQWQLHMRWGDEIVFTLIPRRNPSSS